MALEQGGGGENEQEAGVADDAWNDSCSRSGVAALPAVPRSGEGSGMGAPAGGDGGLERGSMFTDMPAALVLDIFSHLDARELCVVSCVCPLFRRLASDSHGWKDFYCERWPLPAAAAGEREKSWRDLYVDREWRSKALTGRFRMDMLHGHTAPVRCVRMLAPANLIVTAGYDSVVRFWNMEEGLQCACSRAMGEPLRAIALDMSMLAVSGSDGLIRVWNARAGCKHLFDVAGEADAVLRGHTGPVSCLGMDARNLYSGSWDMTVRVWDRGSFECVMSFQHVDWVWALVARGSRVLSSAGSDAYTWDLETGELLRVRVCVHTGQVYAVEASQSGHFLFTGGEDGAVRMFDDRVPWRRPKKGGDLSSQWAGSQGAVAAWIPHGTAVYALAYEDPWLVSASEDGQLAMMNVTQVIKRASAGGKWHRANAQGVFCRGMTAQRMLGGFHRSVYSVDIGADRVVGGGEEPVVRVWDFTQALETERRAQASRSRRLDNRARRKKKGTGEEKAMWAGATSTTAWTNSPEPPGEEVHTLALEWSPLLQAGSSCKGPLVEMGRAVADASKANSPGCLHAA